MKETNRKKRKTKKTIEKKEKIVAFFGSRFVEVEDWNVFWFSFLALETKEVNLNFIRKGQV